jgi:hypothetical protein
VEVASELFDMSVLTNLGYNARPEQTNALWSAVALECGGLAPLCYSLAFPYQTTQPYNLLWKCIRLLLLLSTSFENNKRWLWGAVAWHRFVTLSLSLTRPRSRTICFGSASGLLLLLSTSFENNKAVPGHRTPKEKSFEKNPVIDFLNHNLQYCSCGAIIAGSHERYFNGCTTTERACPRA